MILHTIAHVEWRLSLDYYDNEKNVEDYIKMAEGYDGKLLIDALTKYLPEGSSVLELGMGPGKDLELLSQHYQVTGSDKSAVFVERYQQENPSTDVIQIDALTIDVDRVFDGIYSNKVLYHLTRDELKTSLKRQAKILTDNGIALHSFWYGDAEETAHGLQFVYYTDASLRGVIGAEYEIIDIQPYAEMEDNDSLYIVLQKKAKTG